MLCLIGGCAVRQVKDELYEEEFYRKSNDLYEFLQTDDLKKCTKPLVSKLRDVLYSDKVRAAILSFVSIRSCLFTACILHQPPSVPRCIERHQRYRAG